MISRQTCRSNKAKNKICNTTKVTKIKKSLVKAVIDNNNNNNNNNNNSYIKIKIMK